MVASMLVEFRVNAGLTQADITARTGIHRPIVARIERAVHTIALETLCRYASACGATMRQVTQRIDEELGLGAEPRVTAPSQEETTTLVRVQRFIEPRGEPRYRVLKPRVFARARRN